MGYFTYFEGSADKNEPEIAAEIANLKAFNYREIENPTSINEVISEEPIKWYDHDKDMKSISVKFPDTLITLYGEGEDREDTWIAYFKNGKMCKHYARITFPDFNESELEDN